MEHLNPNDILFFDLEGNGLYREVSTIHCLSVRTTTSERLYVGPEVAEGLVLMEDHMKNGGFICGHNVIGYDIPALQKVIGFDVVQDKVIDTLVLSRLLFGDIGEEDDKLIRREKLPKRLRGSMGLAAWGYRLGEHKGDFEGPWDTYTEAMGVYCSQDTMVTLKLYQRLMKEEPTVRSMVLEHKVQWIIQRQTRRGIVFDIEKARALEARLREEYEKTMEELQEVFPPIFVSDGEFIPKGNNARLGYTAGCPMTKVVVQPFNPGSRDQIADRLTRKYGWQPKEDQLTPTGKPKIDETVLTPLKYPEVEPLLKMFLLQKRLGQLADGQQAWLNKVTPEGLIHGEVNSNGAVTGRMTHSNPNLAQVPAGGAPYGHECRDLFTVRPKYKLVGCDADGLELRCLSHYLAPWDRGAYAKAVDEGKKENGTDIHTLNQKAAGLPTRDDAKTFIYAWL